MYMDVPMNLDNFYSAHEEPVIEGNTLMKTRVKNMEKIKNEVETIIKYGETHQENVNELILKIQLVSNMYFQHYDKTYNIFNYKIKNEDNNNLLMVCCSKKFNGGVIDKRIDVKKIITNVFFIFSSCL